MSQSSSGFEELVISELRLMRESIDGFDKELDNKISDLDKKLDNKVTCMIQKVQETHKEREKCKAESNEKFDKKVNTKMFMWVIGFIILGLLSVSAVSGMNQVNIGKIETQVKNHIEYSKEILGKIVKDIEKHMENSNGYIGPY